MMGDDKSETDDVGIEHPRVTLRLKTTMTTKRTFTTMKDITCVVAGGDHMCCIPKGTVIHVEETNEVWPR